MVVSPTDLFLFACVFVRGSDVCAKMFLCGPEISLLMHTNATCINTDTYKHAQLNKTKITREKKIKTKCKKVKKKEKKNAQKTKKLIL